MPADRLPTDPPTAPAPPVPGGLDLRAILESITDGFLAVDRDWRITYVNAAAAERVYGGGRHGYVGRSYWDAFPGVDESPFGAEYRRAMRDRVAVRVDGYYAPFGRWFEANAYPVDAGGLAFYFRDVTDAKRAEADRRATDERLALLVGHATDYAIVIADPAGVVTEWLAGAGGITGWSSAEAVGKPAHVIFTPEDRAAGVPEAEMRKARETGRAEDKRWHLRKDGTRFFADGVMTALRDEAGGLRGYGKVFRDATDRKLSEERLRDSEGLFRELADAAPAITWMTDPAGRCTYLSRRWYETTGQAPAEGLGFGWVNVAHPDDRDRMAAEFLAANDAGRPFALDYRLRQADGSYRWAVDAGRPRFGPDGAFLGFVGNVFDVHDRRAAEAQYRTLFESIDQGFCVVEMILDPAGRPEDYRFLEANPTFERQTGLAGAVGRTARELVPELEGHWFETYGRVAATGEPARFEAGSDAMGRWFEVDASRVGGPGSRTVAILFRDITARKRTEDALRASEGRYRTLFDSMDEGYCIIEVIFDPAGRPVDYRFLEVNPAFEAQSGMREVVGRRMLEFVPGIEDHWLANYGRVALTGEPVRFANEYKTLGRWFDVYAFRVGPADARRVAVLFTDITARKRTEDALRASEAALAEAQRVAGVGSWEWDPATDRNVVSGELCRIYGLPPGRPIPDFAAQDGTLYPHDSWVRLNAAVREALRTGVGYSLDVEALRGGERIWVTTRGEVVRDPSGRVAGLRGTVQDITARKAAEGEIARLAAESDRQRRVYETILSNTPDLAYVFGLDHRFTYANDVLLRMWGRTWDEAIGKNCLELGYEPWHAALHDREIEQVVATRRPIRGEVPFAGTFGRRIYDYIFVPVLGADGAVVAVAGTTRDVTDRKAAEEAVRASEERFRLAAEAVNGIIYEFDLRAGTVERTRGLAEVLGFGPDEAPPTAEWWRDRIHPDDRPRVVGGVDPAAAPDRLVTEYRVRHRDGRWLHVEDRAVVLRDPAGAPVRLVGCTVDVTARKAAEEAARDGRDRLDFVLRSAGIGLWLNPMPFGKMNWDERVKAHFHLPPDSDPDIDDFWARVHPDDRDRTRRAIDDALAGRADFDADYRTVDPAAGAERWVRAIGRPTFGPDGAPVRFDGVTLDVTARKRAEEALREEDRRKDEFLALLAHELRNPLAPLRNGLQVLRLAPPGSDAAAAAREMMDRQLGHMVRLVDDLLDVSRVTRDKMTLRKARVTLAEVITAAVEGAAPALEAAGHAFTVSLPPEPVELDADLTRLAQVFANLLTNSAKYTPKGGRVELIAECGVRNAESENPTEQSAFVEVTVRDTGLGIPAEFLPRLFDMFSQVDRSVEKATGGLGIGLALVKGLVEMHGGTVAAASPGPGKGSTFTVRLPTIAECGVRSADSKTEEPAHGPGLQSALRTPHSAIGRRRVLVVDDNRDSAESMAEMLRLLGNEVETAHDGLEAVAAAGRVRPDLVLMDVGMPKLNGLDATRRIRGEPWGAGMAIVALTGWGQDDDRARSRAAGCDGHLVKPVSLADLEAAVARVGAAGRNGTA